MTEAEWLTCEDPGPLLGVLGWKADRRKCGLFTVACCRTVFAWLVDARSREAVEVIEAFADGLATEADVERADRRAHRAADIGTGPPARAVSWAADSDPDYICCSRVAHETSDAFGDHDSTEWIEVRAHQAALVRDIFGNPFRLVTLDLSWQTETVTALAREMYESRDFSTMPILADALQDAGCDNDDVLSHCRNATAAHVRGCWVVDLVLGKS